MQKILADAVLSENIVDDLLSKEGSIDNLRLSSILNTEEIKAIMESVYDLLNIPMAIIDTDGQILVEVGWQRICTRFHRVHPASSKNCIESDTELTTGIPQGEFKLYKCKNGMWDLATPIVIFGRHLGNLFLGQFFFSSAPPDVEYFRQQAGKYGFDEKEYIDALMMVPRLNDQNLDKAKVLFLKIAHSISELSFKNIRLAFSLKERNLLMSSLTESREDIRAILDATQESVFMCDADGKIITANLMACRRVDCPPQEISGRYIAELFPQEVASRRMMFITEVFRSGESVAFEDEHNNEVFRHNLFPVFKNGTVTRIVCYSQDITDHKKAENQLRKLYRAVEQAPSSIVITDKTGRIEYVNPVFTSLTGYTPEEVLGQTPRIMQSGRTAPEVYENLWSTIKSGDHWQGTLLNKKKTGELFWESINISPVLDFNGSITHFTAVKQDITEQKKREELLYKLNRTLTALRHSGEVLVGAENEQRYLEEVCRIVVEDCGHALMWIGLTSNDAHKSVRPAASAGFDEDYLKQLNVTYADTEYGRGPTGTAIRTGSVVLCRDILNDPNFKPWRDAARRRGFASSIAVPLKNKGRAFGAITIYAKEPDAFSDDEVRLLTELADDLAYGISTIRLRQAHRQAEEELKKHRDHLEIMVQQRTRELETANEILEKARHEIERHKDQLEEIVRERTHQLALSNSQLKFEIEKEKQVELLLEESLKKERELNELKSRFISTISHEFRTPLTSILSSMQLVQRYRGRWTDERTEEEFVHVKKSVFYLTQLLDDILTISHAESGKIILNRQPVCLEEFCMKIIEEVRHLASEAHNFTFSYSAENREFILDTKLLRFVIINLLSNAFKYSPDGGNVRLEVSSDSLYIKIEVSDEGIGIPKKDKAHLFTPFFRACNTAEIEGTGLGLSIVQKAVELHEGTIDCCSRLGKGTKFIVKIPRGTNE